MINLSGPIWIPWIKITINTYMYLSIISRIIENVSHHCFRTVTSLGDRASLHYYIIITLSYLHISIFTFVMFFPINCKTCLGQSIYSTMNSHETWPRRHQINKILILNPQLKSLRIPLLRFYWNNRHQTIYRRPQLRLKIYTQVCARKISRDSADFFYTINSLSSVFGVFSR